MRAVIAAWDECLKAGRAFSRPAWRYLAATALLWVGQGIQLVLFNLYLVDLGFEEVFVGHVLAMKGLGFALSALPAGLMSERVGCRSILILGFALEGGGAFGRAWMVAPGVLLASSALFGAGMALIAVAGLPFLTRHSTVNERTFLLSSLQSVALVAQVVGSLVGGALPVALFSAGSTVFGSGIAASRAVLVLSAVMIFAAAWPLVTLRGLPGPDVTEADHPLSSNTRSVVRRAVPVFFLVGAGVGLVVPFMNIYFSQEFSSSASQVGVILSAAAICTAVASLAGASLARRYGALRTVAVVTVLSLPFLILLGVTGHLATAVIAYLTGITLMRVGLPLLQSAVMSSIPAADTSRISGIILLSWSVGWAASAALAGALIQRVGFVAPLGLAAGLLATAALILFIVSRGQPRRVPSRPVAPTGMNA